MPEPNAIILATIDSSIRLASNDLALDGAGWFVALPKGSQDTVRPALRGGDDQSHRRITGVRSVSTPDTGNGPWTAWPLDSRTGLYVSPVALSIGDEIRIEVDDSAGTSTVPQGGGHFRVVEEGGGFVLAGPAQTDDDTRSEVSSS